MFEKKQESFQSFGTGKLLPLEAVDDVVFSERMMGDGFALDITDGNLYSPIDGTISMVFPTGHALGIKNKHGELLLHFGIDTVELDGKGFETLVQEGQKVVKGQLITKMDLDYIVSQGKATICMCIFTTGQRVELLKVNQPITYKTNDFMRFIER